MQSIRKCVEETGSVWCKLSDMYGLFNCHLHAIVTLGFVRRRGQGIILMLLEMRRSSEGRHHPASFPIPCPIVNIGLVQSAKA